MICPGALGIYGLSSQTQQLKTNVQTRVGAQLALPLCLVGRSHIVQYLARIGLLLVFGSTERVLRSRPPPSEAIHFSQMENFSNAGGLSPQLGTSRGQRRAVSDWRWARPQVTPVPLWDCVPQGSYVRGQTF